MASESLTTTFIKLSSLLTIFATRESDNWLPCVDVRPFMGTAGASWIVNEFCEHKVHYLQGSTYGGHRWGSLPSTLLVLGILQRSKSRSYGSLSQRNKHTRILTSPPSRQATGEEVS